MPRKPITVLAIDTGVAECGIALFEGVDRRPSRPPVPTVAAVVRSGAGRGQDWTAHAERIVLEVASYLRPESRAVLVPEWPEFRPGSAVGHAAASGGAVFKLAFLCGMYQTQSRVEGGRCVLAPVSTWKGNLPKDLVTKRLKRAVGAEDSEGTPIASHAWDAVGIGLWYLGFHIDDARWYGKGAKG